jgi:hypothetical protein
MVCLHSGILIAFEKQDGSHNGTAAEVPLEEPAEVMMV